MPHKLAREHAAVLLLQVAQQAARLYLLLCQQTMLLMVIKTHHALHDQLTCQHAAVITLQAAQQAAVRLSPQQHVAVALPRQLLANPAGQAPRHLYVRFATSGLVFQQQRRVVRAAQHAVSGISDPVHAFLHSGSF